MTEPGARLIRNPDETHHRFSVPRPGVEPPSHGAASKPRSACSIWDCPSWTGTSECVRSDAAEDAAGGLDSASELMCPSALWLGARKALVNTEGASGEPESMAFQCVRLRAASYVLATRSHSLRIGRCRSGRTVRRSRRRLPSFRLDSAMFTLYFLLFLPIVRLGPLRVREFVRVRCPRTGKPRLCRKPR